MKLESAATTVRTDLRGLIDVARSDVRRQGLTAAYIGIQPGLMDAAALWQKKRKGGCKPGDPEGRVREEAWALFLGPCLLFMALEWRGIGARVSETCRRLDSGESPLTGWTSSTRVSEDGAACSVSAWTARVERSKLD